jgi:protein involved in polysaccharide export with SLBB domain
MSMRKREMGKTKLFVGSVLSFVLMVGARPAQGAERHDGSEVSSNAADQSGDTSKASGHGSGSPFFQERRPRYRLAPGDALELDFPFSPDFNQTVTIQPDGYVTLRDVGDMYVQGKTVPELGESLRGAYGKFLRDPIITVNLKDFQKPYFIAGGEVAHPGKYDLRDDTTLTEAVAIAGGFTQSSKHSEVLLFRRVSDRYLEVKKINLKKMLNSGTLQEDAYLRPGDMFYVPKNRISKVARFLPTSSLGTYFPVY